MNLKTSVLGLAMLAGMVAMADEAAKPAGAAPVAVAIQASNWNGYQKQSFSLDGVPAYVVVPKIAAPGKPWVWRTSFPDYCPVVDLELVRCGYHIGYIEILDLLGSDRALDLMDLFYAQVRTQWNLAEKPVIEPCSRGGLPAYRYAARHPERIACIYGDVPVMDFKSWPMGYPANKVTDWPKIMKAYGFKTEAEALAYPNNPIDCLAPIAKAKIPIRHVICLNDKVVPPEQNTLEARRRLEMLGSTLEAVAVKESKDCDGHHFPYPDVFGSIRFIMKNTCVLPTGQEYFQLRDGLANCKVKFTAEKTGRVAFVGGSITFNPGWRDELMQYLKQKFPETTFDFISTGIPSVGSVGHAFRLENDVLARGPVDLVFVEAAVNDHNYDHLKPEEAAALARRGMEGVVRHLRTLNPMTDVVEMHFAHNIHLPVFAQGKTPYTITEHEKIADLYGCPSLNLSKEVAERIAAKEFTWRGDFRDLHPSPYGQRVYANSMTRMLDAAFETAAAAKAHAVPAQPLDPKSYVNGRYGKLETAKLRAGFMLDPNWIPKVRQEVRAGFGNCPAIVAETPGAEMTYEFEGIGFGLFLAAGRDTGVIDYTIDGGPAKTLDTWTPWSNSLHLPWTVMLADDLPAGKHTVTIRTTDKQKTRTALHIIHILLN